VPKIKFNPILGYENLALRPKPAKIETPDWYKKMPMQMLHMNTPVGKEFGPNSHTVKRCIPLFDGMTSGYLFFSYADIIVKVENGCSRITWSHESNVVEVHEKNQLQGMPLPMGYYKDEAFKWFNPIKIQTPKGYSSLFVSPLIRNELPFQCFPAIVDTDTYTSAIHFPFLIRKNWEGKIPRGTPIMQVIPFKREDWKMDYSDEPIDNDKEISLLKTMFNSAYKKMYWQKKYYI